MLDNSLAEEKRMRCVFFNEVITFITECDSIQRTA